MGHTVIPRRKHEHRREEVTVAQQLLRLHISVRYHTHNGRHKDGDDTLHGVEPGYVCTEPMRTQIIAQAGKITAPDGEL